MENLQELKQKPLYSLTGDQFLFLLKSETPKFAETAQLPKKYVFGIPGIAGIFNCSIPTAARIKASGKIDDAIKQIGRKIVIDAELALELASKKNGGRK